MDNKIIDKIKENLNSSISIENDKPYFSDKRYKPFPIEKTNFHEIKHMLSNKKIVFIDGGNSEIIKTSHLSLQLIKLYYTIYQNNKRIKSEKKQFFVFINLKNKNNVMNYNIEIFNDNLIKEDLTFNLGDPTLSEGIHSVEISKIGETVRRLAELKLIERIMDKLENSIIIRDGSLQSSVTHEYDYFQRIYKKALEKNNIICGLSKTTTLITEKGNSITFVLNKLAPKTKWYYNPIANIDHPDHQADMFFIKLHEKSKHIFRFEIFKKNNYDINEILSILMDNAKDPVFLGYPYGLIEADKFARVSNQEKEYYKTIINSKLNIDLREGHDILDNIG